MTRVTRFVFAVLFISPIAHASSTLLHDSTITPPGGNLPPSRPVSSTMEESLPEEGAVQPMSAESASDIERRLAAFVRGKGSSTAAAESRSEREAVASFGEVVVTAARYPTPRRETPDTVSVVTRADLGAGNALDLGDAVSRTAGVEVVRHGGPGTLSSITVRGSRPSQVLVMQDGRPLNSVSSGDANASLVPEGAIDRVEVLRGPSGLLYGSSPLGGVVNVITARPPDRFSGSLAGQDGTYGTSLTRVEPNGDVASEDTFAKAEAFENPRIEVQAGTFDDALGVPGPKPAGDPLLRTSTQAYFGDALSSSLTDRQQDHRRYVMTGLSYSPGAHHEFSLRHYAEENRLDFTSGSYFGFGDATRGGSRMTTRIMGVEGEYVTGPWEAEKARLTAGGSWRRERLSEHEDTLDLVTGDTVTAPGFHAAAETGAGYAELSIRPLARMAGVSDFDPAALEGLTVVGGARRDQHSIFGGVTNHHAGAAWELGGTTARVSAGETFRAPTLNDLFWPSTVYAGGNPDLRPERGRTFEWSLERTEGGMTGRRTRPGSGCPATSGW
jgi:outer membrane receptor protein involved in Fe transport